VEEVLIVKFGEVALRGKNRYIFENKLIAAIENNLKGCPGYFVSRELGRYVVCAHSSPFDFARVIPKVISVLGIISCCPAIRSRDMSMENIKKLSLLHMKKRYPDAPVKGYTFRVTAHRSHKDYPVSSQEIAACIGECIIEGAEGFKVNLKEPEINLRAELRNQVYIYSDETKGFGGLPVGSCGKTMALLSAGIDSPVASFLMARRGVEVEAVYFHTPPYTSERALLKVTDICEVLKTFTASFKLNVVNFTDIQMLIKEKTPPEKFTIMLKRSMMRLAEILAQKNECQALTTGDSVGQVASQTLKSIAAIDGAVSIPVLRPLAGMDKNEIIDWAKKIGTFDISIRPFQDCCTLFVPPHPETKPKVSIIESFEKSIDNLYDITKEAAENVKVYNF
jgi:thiamine biosynthesis protein ThiI